ncbi:MAG TPA: AAA family ATPase, partial [Candidatus Dormibacteraeota bacterium]|nr:AAA family ATPase [Candidatus Dormibacteraeota bacterium]
MRVTALTLTNFQSFADSGRIPLHPITLFVGKNNSGKSAIINALSLVQSGLIQRHNELVRVGASQAEILLEAEDLPATYRLTGSSAACLHLMLQREGQIALHVRRDDGNGASEPRPQFPSDLSGAVMLRLSADNALRIFDERINAQLSRQITADITNLPALISSLVTIGHPRSADFAAMTSHLFGFHFGLISTEIGQLPGLV